MGHPTAARDAVSPALRGPRLRRIRETVDVDELVSQFRAGRMIKELAEQYGISRSSLKRLLRESGVRRSR